MGYPNPQLIQPGAAQHLDNLAHLHEDKVEKTLQNLFGHSDAINLDAVSTAGTGQYFQQALEANLEEAEARQPDQNIFRFFEVNSTLGEGAGSYAQKIKDYVGRAKVVGDDGGPSPRVDAVKKKISRDIINLRASYDWSVFDIMKARFAGEDLETDKGAAARAAIDYLHNDIGWYGREEDSVWGLLTHPRISRFLFSNKIDSVTDGNTIVAEMVDWFGTVEDVTNDQSMATQLILPPQEHRHIAHRELSSGGGTKIIDWIRGNDENGIQSINRAWELKPENTPSGKALAVAVSSMADPQYVAPLPFRSLPAQRDGLEFVVENVGRSGGFYTPRPFEIVVAELKR